jgi:modulator of FtsH protease HflK
MSDEHQHHSHSHEHEHPATEAQDAASQAMSEALRSSFAIVKIVMVLLVALFFFRGFFTVQPQEKAVILRFGKPVGEGQKILLGPGLHWSFPYPIDEVVRIPISEIQKVTSNNGWYFTTPEQELSGEELPAGPSLNPAIDGYVITADRNIIHTKATLYYQVDKPIQYIFDFTSASNAIQNALDNALLYTAARFNVDAILYNDVEGFREAVEQRVSELADQENLGITINHCDVQSIPPRQLQDIFDQVTEARENRNKVLDDAHSYENQSTNNAEAQASSIIQEAISARSNYVASVQSDASAFSALLTNYEVNPGLFEQQELVQMMGGALTNVQTKIFLPERLDGQPRELRLLLNREPPEPKPEVQNSQE